MAKAFNGEFRLAVDEKHRILIPAAIRAKMDPETRGTAFTLIIGTERSIWFYPEKTFDLMTDRLNSSLAPDRNQSAFERILFSQSETVEPDKQGRLVVPDRLLKRAGIERDVALLGVRDHLELWPADRWDLEQQRLSDDLGPLSEQFRLLSGGHGVTV